MPENPPTLIEEGPPFSNRFWEIFPGATMWFFIVLPLVLAFTFPAIDTAFVLIFDIFWLIKSLVFGAMTIIGHYKMNSVMKTDWHDRINRLDNPEIDWHDLWQVVILATYKESLATLEKSIDSIAKTDYPRDRMILVLATEQRDSANAQKIAAKLSQRFSKYFAMFLVTEHPDGIIGELKGKGANVTWAAKQLSSETAARGISPGRILVSTADADTLFPSQYFLRLSYLYVVTPDRDRCAYQPVATFFNNIWQAPMLSRVLAFGTTFWQLIESLRPYRLITFSTHSMSLKTLQEINYWCTSIVSEDSRQYFRSYFHYHGDFHVVPIFMPIYMDAVYVGNLKDSIKNLYLQQQRWAYGVEHFPYIVEECERHHEIPLWDRLALIWRAFEGNFSWAMASYFITFVGWMPLLLNPKFSHQLLSLNFQIFTRDVLGLTWLGLLISAYITVKILPDAPKSKSRLAVLTMVLQWLLVPVTTLIFGSIPAIDAQTHFMLGKYMGFRVTPKVT